MKRSIPPVPSLVHFHFEARFIPEAIRAEKDCKQGPDSHKNLWKGRGSVYWRDFLGRENFSEKNFPSQNGLHII